MSAGPTAWTLRCDAPGCTAAVDGDEALTDEMRQVGAYKAAKRAGWQVGGKGDYCVAHRVTL